jgi:urease accessory protein UreF
MGAVTWGSNRGREMAGAQTRQQWLAQVLHDLVKYLEMMPRSLDWDALADDDADIVYEAVFETRSGRQDSESALQIWRRLLESMPAGCLVAEKQTRISQTLEELETRVSALNGGSLDGIDTARIRQLIFSVGDELRASSAQHGSP